MTVVVGVALLGAVGSCARYLLDRAVTRRQHHDRPWGTFVINACGSLILGLLVGLLTGHHLSTTTEKILGTGFCGSFTTFSTFVFETQRLAEDRRMPEAVGNVAIGLAVGLVLAGIGLSVGSAL
jgi:CrcB protein